MKSHKKHNTKTRRIKKRVVSIALSPTSQEFLAYRENENRKQKQLADIEAQVDRIAEAVVRWLLDNPSAKEQPYFLSLQERLAELTEIIARLVQRKSLPTDGQQWSATRTEALSLLEKSGQSAGFIAVLPEVLPGIGMPANEQQPLTAREAKIWDIIQRGSTGLQYCRELDNAGVSPPRKGIWEGGSRKYEPAYKSGNPWRHWIQDEKSKIRCKANSQNSLASKSIDLTKPA